MSTTTGRSSPSASFPTSIALLQPLSIGRVTTNSSAGNSDVCPVSGVRGSLISS